MRKIITLLSAAWLAIAAHAQTEPLTTDSPMTLLQKQLLSLSILTGVAEFAPASTDSYSGLQFKMASALSYMATNGTGGSLTVSNLVVSDPTGLGGMTVDVRWFGAVSGDSTSDAAAFQAAANFCMTNGRTLYIPGGTWNFGTNDFLDVTGELNVVGDGALSRMQHASTTQTDHTAFFSVDHGCTKLTIRGVQFAGALAAVTVPTGNSLMDAIRIENVISTNCSYLLYADQAMQTNQLNVKAITIANSTFYGTTDQGAMLWWKGMKWDTATVRDNHIMNGTDGIVVGWDTPALDLNPLLLAGTLEVRGNWFEGSGHATLNCHGVWAKCRRAVIEANTFRLGCNVSSSGAEQHAIFLFSLGAQIGGNLFDRWGSDYTKKTIYLQGPSLAYNQWNTNSFPSGTAYNNTPGWGVRIVGNTFNDNATNSVGCGGIYLNTDRLTVADNIWTDPGSSSRTWNLVHFQPTAGTVYEYGDVDVRNNTVVRGYVPSILFLRSPSSGQVHNIRFVGNRWYNRAASDTQYALECWYASKNVLIEGNVLFNCPGLSVARFGLNSGSSTPHQGFNVQNNYLTNASYVFYLNTGANNPAHTLDTADFRNNVIDKCSGVLNLAANSVLTRARFEGNYATNSTRKDMNIGSGAAFTDVAYRSNAIWYANIGSTTSFAPVHTFATPTTAGTVVDMLFATATNNVSGSLTYAAVTNGASGIVMEHTEILPNWSGSDQTLTLPAGWKKSTALPAPSKLTNGVITLMRVRTLGSTADSNNQTNVVVSFDYCQ